MTIHLAEKPALVWAAEDLAQRSLERQSATIRYGFSIVCVAIALGGALACQYYGFRAAASPFFDMAIVLTAWYAGVGPSVLAVLLSTASASYLFVEPKYSFEISRNELPYFLLFTAWATIIAWFVTVRRRIERDLRLARDKLQNEAEEQVQQTNLLNLTLDLTHDAILVRDMDALITYWNRGAEELYGWSLAQAMGKQSHTLFRTVFPAPLADIESQLLRTGRWEGELKHTKPDGSQVIMFSRWSLRRDEAGLPVAVLETNNDITDRKRREGQIERLNQQLTRRSAELTSANTELEAFAYSVSHDLRAPLRHAVGYSELLQRHAASSLDEKSRRYIQTILDSSKRMGQLIDDLLAFSRIGRTETRKTMVSLDQLVQELVADIRQDTTGRDVLWKIGPLPVCYGDRSMLRLVIGNLLSNAVKFTRIRSRAEIEIGCVDSEDEADVFVRDNGAGFDMQYANKLFGVFQRLHHPEEFEGTGIGLATVQRIVHSHGGKVRAEGAVDQGATFYFSLPKTRDAAAERTANTP
jgi:PAS domain S-box-containing protein